MSLHAVIAEHVPSLRHLIGVVSDDELASRAIEELTDEILSEDEVAASIEQAADDARDEGERSAKDDIREELYQILNDKEWTTADELAKLVREIADEL